MNKIDEANVQPIQWPLSFLRMRRDVYMSVTAVALSSLQIERKHVEYCIHEVKKNIFNFIQTGSFLAFKLLDFVFVCVKSIESFLENKKTVTGSEIRHLTHGKLLSLLRKIDPDFNSDGICERYALTVLEDLLEGSSYFITNLKKLDNLMGRLKEEDQVKKIKEDKDLSNFFNKLDQNLSKQKTDSLIGAISGTYTHNPQDLLPLMLSFQEQLNFSSIPFKSLAFLIGSKHHSIVFEFNSEENVYRLIDVNDLNTNILPLDSISGKISRSYDFSSERSKAFSIQVFLSTDKKTKLDSKSIFNDWKTSFSSKQAQSLSFLSEEEKINWLCSASDSNDEQSVSLLIGAGVNVNQTDEEGSIPLYLASQNGHENIVEILVQSGANVHQPNKKGFAPLHVASQNGLEKVVEILVQSGADVNQPDKKGFTPLHSASQCGHENVVEILLNKGSNVNEPNKNGSTPLSLASDEKVVELLLKKGADVNQPDKKGFTPLHWASQSGHEKVVEILLDKGANVNRAGADGFTPLYMACQKGHEKVVEILISNGANVDLAVDGGYTPLFMACQKGHQKVVQMLIDAGANVNLTNKSGTGPLLVARYMGHRKIEQMLLRANEKS